MSKYPQTLINVPISDFSDFKSSERVQQAVKDAKRDLAGRGRVLLRPSGTEPLVRVMVEGQDPAYVKQLAERIAAQVSEAAATTSKFVKPAPQTA
jgi:phosphoglucosamine mutase